MLDTLRKPPLVVAVVLMVIVVLIELGSMLLGSGKTPGSGIPTLPILDGLLAWTILLIAAPILIPESVQGRIQGILTLIVSIVVLLFAIFKGFAILAKLIVMVSLLLAPIFGTLAYVALFGHFQRGDAAVTLSLIMMLKLVFAALLIIAHQSFLKQKSLVLLVLTSLLANIVISFLHGFVPIVLVSITDSIAAIVIVILAVIWAIYALVTSIISIVRVIV